MSWEDKSDIGIAIAVQEKLEGSELLNGNKIGRRFIEMNAVMKEFDPCNRADHAWPIILKYRINVYASEGPEFMPWMAGLDSIMVSNKNPLRAAMIVFLMMQER